MRLFKQRPVAEYGVFLCALIATPVVRLSLGLVSLRFVRQRLFRSLSAGEPLSSEKRLPAKRVVRSAGLATRLSPAPTTCLVTALVCEALLKRHGHNPQLRVGVQKKLGSFAAHAWLELDGSVIVGGPLGVVEEYTPFPGVENLLV